MAVKQKITIEAHEAWEGNAEAGIVKLKRDLGKKKRNSAFSIANIAVDYTADQPPCIQVVPTGGKEVDTDEYGVVTHSESETLPLTIQVNRAELYRHLKHHRLGGALDLQFYLTMKMLHSGLFGGKKEIEITLPAPNGSAKPEPYSVEVTIQRRLAELVAELVLEDTPDGKWYYHKGKQVPLGTLTIRNQPDLAYAYGLDVKDLEVLLVDTTTGQRHACVLPQGGPTADPAYEGSTPGGYYLREVGPETHRSLSLQLAWDALDFSHEKMKLDVVVVGSKKVNGSDYVEFESTLDTITVDWDQQATELRIQYKRNTKLIPITTQETPASLPEIIYHHGGDRLQTLVEAVLENVATTDPEGNGLAGIKILEPKLNFAVQNTNSMLGGVTLDDLVEVTWVHRDKVVEPKDITLLNEPDSKLGLKAKLDLGLLDRHLDPLQENRLEVLAILDFSYQIIFGNGQADSSTHSVIRNFEFVLRQHEGSEWIVLDVGTSAHVAIKRTGRDQQETLNLQERLQTVLKEDNKELADNRSLKGERYEEQDTYFLSSSTLLFPNHDESANFWKDFILMSPPEDLLKAESQNLLPYIKGLIGQNKLPKSFISRLNEREQESARKIETKALLQRIYFHLLKRILVLPENTNKLVLLSA